ncbi:hypothetical protein [Sciscionella marina]|uniref:hypothetical protein n=1 Tax=Sciscionella marina TaxID=508770 RepID=UPI00036E4D8C|nr:hypothetical protein [Sciscionella marina]
MRIRITGTEPETRRAAALIAELFPVRETSRFYRNRSGELGRIYMEVQSAQPPPSP